LLHREASPLSRGGLERRLLTRSEFAVYDFDDALQSDWGAGGWVRRLAPKAPKALISVTMADRVIAGSPMLAEWASEHNRDVVLIPSCVSPMSYEQKTDYRVSDPPRLGWIGSVANEAYILPLAPALHEIHRRTGARLTLISGARRTLGDLEALIDRVAWSEAAQHSTLAHFDIGIMPLPDTPYTRGKAGYKILQYAAAGTPAIGSPVGVNGRLLSELGMPAPATPDEWTDAILDVLTRSVATREMMGRSAHRTIQQRYSYDAWLPRWEHAVGVIESPKTVTVPGRTSS
jgi:glycosyltransferase involved in cell wall biosynthesis